MSTICPCCGHASDKVPPIWMDEDSGLLHANGKTVHISNVEGMIVTALAKKYPGVARKEHIINAVWGRDPNGGPDNPDNNLKVHISRIRKTVKAIELDIEAIWGRGYKFVMVKGDKA